MTPKDLTPTQHSDIGSSFPTDFKAMEALASELLAMCKQKNKEYGEQWKKKGGVGAYFQGIDRKIGRIETQAKAMGYNLFDVTEENGTLEGFDDTLADLINYAMLTLVTRRRIREIIASMPTEYEDNDGLDGPNR